MLLEELGVLIPQWVALLHGDDRVAITEKILSLISVWFLHNQTVYDLQYIFLTSAWLYCTLPSIYN